MPLPADRQPPVSITPLGERGFLLRWPARIDPVINDAVHACAARLRTTGPGVIEDIVPAYASLAVLIDAERSADEAVQRDVEAWLQQALSGGSDVVETATTQRLVEIPLRYGGADGPDLEAVARAAGLDPAEVIARHCAVEYRVGLLGFAPGFPYLIGLDPSLATPRRETPRTQVPAGSVGIGGAQTGIYPQQGPGGWQLIGRTDVRLFDPARDPPSLLAPGDRVRFVEIAR
jgi:KipI family sensor histidine kinase inhibitor